MVATEGEARCISMDLVQGFEGARQALRRIDVWAEPGVPLDMIPPGVRWDVGVVQVTYLGRFYRLPVDTSAETIRVTLRDGGNVATAAPIWAREC